MKSLKLFTTGGLLFLVLLFLTLAGPANARQFASFYLVVEQNGEIWGEENAAAPIKKKMTQVESAWPPGMYLDVSFLWAENFKGVSGEVCFSGGVEPGGIYPGPFVVQQQRDLSAHVNFYFVAEGKDGSPDHKYVIQMDGDFDDPANFPPSAGTTVTMTAGTWELSTEGKGQDRKNTCTGEGVFSPAVTVTVTSTD